MLRHTFSRQVDGPHLLITGGVHGDEFEPILAIRRLLELFSIGAEPQQPLVGKLTLIPLVNESAFRRGHRCGEDDLDLARTCPGTSGGSVTERTAHELSQLIRSCNYYIDLHSGGTTMNVMPLAGYMLHPDEQIRHRQREMAKAFNLPIVWGTSAAHDGRSLSVARDAGIPAIYCEYGGSGICTDEGVTAYVEGCLNVMRTIGMMPGTSPLDHVQYVVEDLGEESGHMQVCHPSPVDGYFDAAVTTGELVQRGSILGKVTDLSTGDTHNVKAEHTGIVIVLRTFPAVRANDALGVVLDLNPTVAQQNGEFE